MLSPKRTNREIRRIDGPRPLACLKNQADRGEPIFWSCCDVKFIDLPVPRRNSSDSRDTRLRAASLTALFRKRGTRGLRDDVSLRTGPNPLPQLRHDPPHVART